MFSLYNANGTINMATLECIVLIVLFAAFLASIMVAEWQIKRLQHERHRLYDAIRRYNQATNDDYDYFKMW